MKAALLAKAALIGMLAGIPAPAAAQPNPYDEAVAARLAGEPGRAVELLEPWVAANPQDVDARLQLGYALLAINDFDAAEAEFRFVLSAAPDYADASEGLALIERRRGAPSARQRYVYVEGAISDLSQDREDWSEVAAGALLPLGTNATSNLRATYYRRFGVEDIELTGGATVQVSANSWFRFSGSATPSADFRPEWSIAAGVEHRMGDAANPTLVGLDVSFQRFPAQDVLLLSPMVTQYFNDGGLSLTARGNAVRVDSGSFRFGGSLRADYFASERTRFFLGAATGPDTDLGVVTETTALFVGAEFPLVGTVSLTASAAREWRDDGIDRSEGRLGLRLSF
ncbi:MAG: YaiO family outer membrane beta-barrel protein [Alphaproteobacteria bacterium]|nr:YaiO family outer membrane beta-barrel protein [Alphaproteobacteria bacterium]